MDSDGEYLSHSFRNFLSPYAMLSQLFCPVVHAHNGVADIITFSRQHIFSAFLRLFLRSSGHILLALPLIWSTSIHPPFVGVICRGLGPPIRSQTPWEQNVDWDKKNNKNEKSTKNYVVWLTKFDLHLQSKK